MFASENNPIIKVDSSFLIGNQEELLEKDIDVITQARQEELKMQIAAALSQRKIFLSAKNKEVIAKDYQRFSGKMYDLIKSALDAYTKALRDIEEYPSQLAKNQMNNYAETKVQRDCQLIQHLVTKYLDEIYKELDL